LLLLIVYFIPESINYFSALGMFTKLFMSMGDSIPFCFKCSIFTLKRHTCKYKLFSQNVQDTLVN